MSACTNESMRLGAGRVEVWLVATEDINDESRSAARAFLNESEHARNKRFRVEESRDQHLVGRVLVRRMLSRYAAVPERAWIFETNRYGRPSVLQPAAFRHLHFNMSHTDGLVACAVSERRAVGVDVENVGREVDPVSLGSLVFAPEEMAAVLASPPERRRDRFFSYWTLKESYIKARGLGVSLPLEAFWFDLDVSPPRVHFKAACPDDPGRWRFWRFVPTPEHMLAVAVSTLPGDEPEIQVNRAMPLDALVY
jgi:4'-phosphopantetheinyl transferase